VNRFVQGMVAAVEPPDFATRRNILSAKLGRLGRKLSDDALDRLADVAPPNVRELEGVLTTYLAHLDIEGRSPDAGTVYELFAVAGAPAPAGASAAARIEQAVADLFGVKPSDLAGTRRGNGLNHARQMLMYLLRERTNWTLQQIADHLGRKNHTTVLMGHRRMQDAIDADEPVPLPGCPKDGLPGAKAVMERIAAALSNGSAPMRANGA
jgi:chromosomal replication initiator protein